METVPEEDKAEMKKITQLLLNTPGACFLCLEDNERDDEGGLLEEDLNGGIVDLSNICRYLNIKQCSLLLTSLKNDGGVAGGVEDLEQHSCTFSVNLCQKCLKLTEKLNETIVQLEKAKLVVNFHLQTFHKVLEGKRKDEKMEWIDLQKRMNTNSDNTLEAKLVQLFREEAKDKSFKILKKAEAAMPQIILSKCELPPPISSSTSYHPPPPPPEQFPIPSTSSSPSIKTLLSHLIATNAIPSSKKSRKSKLYRCPYCTKVLGPSKISEHLSCLHSDKLISSLFLPPSLPPSEEICRQVLYSQVIAKAGKIRSCSAPTAPPRLGCHLCGISYSDGNLLKQHFLITHTEQLCEEIINFGKKPQKIRKLLNPPKILSKMITSKAPPPSHVPESKSVDDLIKKLLQTSLINPSSEDDKNKDPKKDTSKRYQCPSCGTSMVYSKFIRHLANFHPDKLLPSLTPSLDKLKNDNPNQFSQLCRKVLASQVTLAVKLAVTPEVTDVTSSSSVSSKLGCHLCPRKYSDRRNLKHHFLVDHTDILCEQLIKMQNVKVGTQDKQSKRMVTEKVKPLKDKPLKVKRLRRSLSEENKTCTICRQTFSKLDKLQRHLVTQHPDQLFLKCKPSWMGEEQFEGICKGIFRGEVREATYGKPGDKIYKCGYCPRGKRSYKEQDYLVVHLAYQHRREMEEKLKQDQSNGRRDDNEGMGEKDEGGDHMVMEEDACEFDMKPDVGELDKMMNEDKMLDELISIRNEADDLQQQYGYFEEDGAGGGDCEVDDNGTTGNMTDEQLELPDNQSASPIIKMEAVIPDEYYN